MADQVHCDTMVVAVRPMDTFPPEFKQNVNKMWRKHLHKIAKTPCRRYRFINVGGRV